MCVAAVFYVATRIVNVTLCCYENPLFLDVYMFVVYMFVCCLRFCWLFTCRKAAALHALERQAEEDDAKSSDDGSRTSLPRIDVKRRRHTKPWQQVTVAMLDEKEREKELAKKKPKPPKPTAVEVIYSVLAKRPLAATRREGVTVTRAVAAYVKATAEKRGDYYGGY